MEEHKSDLVYVDYKNSLLKNQLEKRLEEAIVAKIHSLNEYQQYKVDVELILLVCNLVENGMSDYGIKIDKKQFVIKVLSRIYTYSPNDIKHIDEIIQFLYDNNRIKRVKLWKKVTLIVWDWIKRKIL